MVFISLVERIKNERYLDNDTLTPELEEELQQVPGIIVYDFGDGMRTYTLEGMNYI